MISINILPLAQITNPDDSWIWSGALIYCWYCMKRSSRFLWYGTYFTCVKSFFYHLYNNNVLFLLVWCNKLGIVHCIYRGVTGSNFQIKLQLTLTQRYDAVLTSVLRFSGVVSRIERCGAHFWEIRCVKLFDAVKIHVQIMRLTCCLNMVFKLIKHELGPRFVCMT